jgi:hypothetical protein
MNRDQVQEEKLAVQKALLHFESIHGRPVSIYSINRIFLKAKLKKRLDIEH